MLRDLPRNQKSVSYKGFGLHRGSLLEITCLLFLFRIEDKCWIIKLLFQKRFLELFF